MENNIPFLSHGNINQIENYIPFYHAKAYMKQKSGSLKYFKNQTPQIKKIAEKVGYKDFNQFIKHRKLWHNFEKKIPLSYLKSIDVKLDVLKFTIELDQKAYQKALKLPRYPKSYIIQTRPFPLTKRLPKDISEEKAVELVQREAIIQNKSCVINYPYLKKILIDRDGSVLTAYYKPDIKIEGDYIIPDKINDFTGKMSL